MKLTVKSGESIDAALQYLRDFLEKYKGEYPALIGNMNVYINLEGAGRKVCPDNVKAFWLSEKGPVDAEDVKILAVVKKAKLCWEEYLRSKRNEASAAVMQYKREKSSWTNAVDKGLQETTIASRSKKALAAQEAWAAVDIELQRLEKFNVLLERNQAEWFLLKAFAGAKPYDYTIVPYIIFTTEDNKQFHFVGYENLYGVKFGRLKNGLPKDYYSGKTVPMPPQSQSTEDPR